MCSTTPSTSSPTWRSASGCNRQHTVINTLTPTHTRMMVDLLVFNSQWTMIISGWNSCWGSFKAQELWESPGGHPGLPIPVVMVSVCGSWGQCVHKEIKSVGFSQPGKGHFQRKLGSDVCEHSLLLYWFSHLLFSGCISCPSHCDVWFVRQERESSAHRQCEDLWWRPASQSSSHRCSHLWFPSVLSLSPGCLSSNPQLKAGNKTWWQQSMLLCSSPTLLFKLGNLASGEHSQFVHLCLLRVLLLTFSVSSKLYITIIISTTMWP